ncbi:unnamed protein product [Durusdinium trenchii]|uniref:Rab-GAP TBC domain-containing protein n=1 Tax=Durusdinium trenchii TaxID=1381693 RepID=A0ABP0K6V7_9DINO
MLLGYLPPVQDRQPSGLQKKREEYEELRRRHYLPVEAEAPSGDVDGAILRQIRLDIPRTSPGLPIFGHQRIQQLLERILFIWSLRHPASGYVQGINDLATPFVVVLLASELDCLPEEINVDAASDDTLDAVEAGAYWCLTKFLSDIQDHYTSGQPGIQQMVAKLREIVHRIDQKLYDHLEEQGLDFLQLSFRWMNCLLLREFPFPCVIRLWDTYIAEPLEGFSSFHVYASVCSIPDLLVSTAETNGLSELGLAPYVTRPLKIKEDLKANRYFIASEYNYHAGSHRSPWTDRYIPSPPGGEAEEEKLFRPPGRLGRLEQTFNEVFAAYATSYYEGSVSSVYLWDLEEGYAGAFLIRKELPKIFGDGKNGVWDAVHLLEVRDAANSHYVDFKLSSAVVLHTQVSQKEEQTEISAHLTRQAESRLDRRKKSGEDAQVIQIGTMIEDNENFLRQSLECIHVAHGFAATGLPAVGVRRQAALHPRFNQASEGFTFHGGKVSNAERAFRSFGIPGCRC